MTIIGISLNNAIIFFIGSILQSALCFGQLLEVDYTKDKREENSFRIQFIRTGIVGISSLNHLDITLEAAKLSFYYKNGSYLSFTLYGTNTLWLGNRENLLNTFAFLMNPIGGDINGSLFFSYPLSKKELQNTKIALSLGKKWIQGQPLPNFESNSFFDNYGRLGWVFQGTLSDDALTNSSLYFWTFPSILFHHGTVESRRKFFDNKLDPFSYGYAIELGLEYNTQLKVSLIGQQILNSDPSGDFGRVVARLIVGYRF